MKRFATILLLPLPCSPDATMKDHLSSPFRICLSNSTAVLLSIGSNSAFRSMSWM